jgi:predicted amino acid-binding ACT domain protein
MELSPELIKEIARQVTAKLGAQVGPDEVAATVREIIARLPIFHGQNAASNITPEPAESRKSKKLIINAFGISGSELSDKIKSFIAGKALRVTDISATEIDTFSSLIVILDYSDYQADLTQLKFELEKICSGAGFKAIIQDSGYYKPH